MIDTGVFKFDLGKFDELMIEAMNETRENDYHASVIVAGYLSSLENALVYNGFNRESIYPILKETSEKLCVLYNAEVKGSENNAGCK